MIGISITNWTVRLLQLRSIETVSSVGRLWGVRSTFCPSVHVDTAALKFDFQEFFPNV
jgi:hypothetical protein